MGPTYHWDRPAYGAHVSVSPFYVGSPPPPRLHLRHPFKSFHPTVIEGVDTDRWCGNALPPTPSPLYKALPILALGPSRNPNSYPPHQDQSQLSRDTTRNIHFYDENLNDESKTVIEEHFYDEFFCFAIDRWWRSYNPPFLWWNQSSWQKTS